MPKKDQLEEVLRTRYDLEIKLRELEQQFEGQQPSEDVRQLQKERDFYQNAYRKVTAQDAGLTDEHMSVEQITGS